MKENHTTTKNILDQGGDTSPPLEHFIPSSNAIIAIDQVRQELFKIEGLSVPFTWDTNGLRITIEKRI